MSYSNSQPVHQSSAKHLRSSSDEQQLLSQNLGPPQKRFKPSLADFLKLTREDVEYVDKTSFLEAYLNNASSHVLLLEPRRSGKTVMLSTIQ
jgi:Predicted AAA-ATPase